MRDIVIGMSDGLTVPFALAAGIVLATTAEAVAGTVATSITSISFRRGGLFSPRAELLRTRPVGVVANGSERSA